MGKAIIVKRMSNPHTLANCVVTTFLLWLVAEILNVNIACKHRIKLMTQRRSVCVCVVWSNDLKLYDAFYSFKYL